MNGLISQIPSVDSEAFIFSPECEVKARAHLVDPGLQSSIPSPLVQFPDPIPLEHLSCDTSSSISQQMDGTCLLPVMLFSPVIHLVMLSPFFERLYLLPYSIQCSRKRRDEVPLHSLNSGNRDKLLCYRPHQYISVTCLGQ
jgi:hypothetical protein